MKVWVLTSVNRHGTSATVHANEDLVEQAAVESMLEDLERWAEPAPKDQSYTSVRAVWDNAASSEDELEYEALEVEGFDLDKRIVAIADMGGSAADQCQALYELAEEVRS